MRAENYFKEVFRETWYVSIITLFFIPILIWVAHLLWYWSILLGALFSILFAYIAYFPKAIDIKFKAFKDALDNKAIVNEEIRIPLEPSKFVEFENTLEKVNSYYKTVNYIPPVIWFACGNFLVFLAQQANLLRKRNSINIIRIFIWNKYLYSSEMAKRLLFINIYLGGDSAPNRPLIPFQIGHPFRLKSATDSAPNRPPIPIQIGHPSEG